MSRGSLLTMYCGLRYLSTLITLTAPMAIWLLPRCDICIPKGFRHACEKQLSIPTADTTEVGLSEVRGQSLRLMLC